MAAVQAQFAGRGWAPTHGPATNPVSNTVHAGRGEGESEMAVVHAERRLVVILAADAVGFSRLMGENEESTLGVLKECRSIIDAAIARHGGRIFHTAGDAVMAEFGSAVAAVRCAAEFQAALDGQDRDTARPAMAFRVGINLGDVMVEGDQLFGDGVNVAARLEGIAEPGGICVSATVFDQVRGKLSLAFDPMGSQRLKNIAEPVTTYRVRPNGDPSPGAGHQREQNLDAGSTRTLKSGRPAIAVLPFDIFGGAADQEAFADGLVEDLITALAAWRSFPVIARNSSFAYKGTSPDIREVATELGARYVLEGSVRFAAGRVRVNVQLIDAENGHHLWAEKIDREIEDIFDVQDQITRRIAGIVEPELSMIEGRRVQLQHPDSLDAWSWVQRGYAQLDLYTAQGNKDARECFERAIEIEQDYSRAWLGIAYTHHRDIMLEATDDLPATLAANMEAARNAARYDDMDSMVHAGLGGAFLWSGKFDEAIAEGHRALELNPSDYLACGMLATALNFAGRPDESFPYFDMALELNPRDPRQHVMDTLRARAHLNARDPQAAVEWAEIAVRRRSDYPLAHLVLAAAYGHLGRSSDAEAALAACTRINPSFAQRWVATRMYRNPADDEYFAEGLAQAGFRV